MSLSNKIMPTISCIVCSFNKHEVWVSIFRFQWLLKISIKMLKDPTNETLKNNEFQHKNLVVRVIIIMNFRTEDNLLTLC